MPALVGTPRVQFSNILTGSGTSWMSTIGDAGDTMATAAVYTSVEAGFHTSDTFAVTGSNNISGAVP